MGDKTCSVARGSAFLMLKYVPETERRNNTYAAKVAVEAMKRISSRTLTPELLP
jgi:hypothetical protein